MQITSRGRLFFFLHNAFIIVLLCFLVGCGSSVRKPSNSLELIDSQTAANFSVNTAWSVSLGEINYFTHIQPRNGLIAVSTSTNDIVVLDEQGQAVWRASINAPVIAGVGFDGQRAAVVTAKNELLVLDKGKILWSKPLRGRVSTAPLVSGERVFILGLDRAVEAYDALDGRYLWRFHRPGEPLVLQFPGVLSPHKNTLLLGSGSKLLGLNSLTGSVQWELNIGIPKGLDEIERLAELVGPIARPSSNLFCVRAYQLAVGCVDADKSSLLWSRNITGAEPVAATSQLMVATDNVDKVVALNSKNGQNLWTNESLIRGGLSAPIIWGSFVVMGDNEGIIHFLNLTHGKTILRYPAAKSPIHSVPVIFGKNLLVTSSNGSLIALRISEK